MQNKLLRITYEDAASIASRKHPKALYVECLKQSNNWRAYAASESYGIDDMAMLVCKDVGCAVNYCSLVKMDYPSLWEGSSDCQNEIKEFNNCMVSERRRYAWMDKAIRPPLFDYTYERIKERAQLASHNLLNEEEKIQVMEAVKEANKDVPSFKKIA